VARILIVATAGAGGDLPPLVAASMALRERGHDTIFIGDAAVRRILEPLHVEVEVLRKELDLGPRLAGTIQDAMQATGGNLEAAGPLLQRGMTIWAHDVAEPISVLIARHRPSAIVTSLFGVEAVDMTCPAFPWGVVNSTFYIGPNPPRPLEDDIGSRALPLIRRYAELLEAADLVLHATDQLFDYGYTSLPSRHHYVGPLGIWEPPQERPAFLDQPGDPWILVSISSQRQDDIQLAQAAVAALADQPVRVLVTLGPEHEPSELASPPPTGTRCGRGCAPNRCDGGNHRRRQQTGQCQRRDASDRCPAFRSTEGEQPSGKCGDADRVAGRGRETGAPALAADRQPARPRRFIASNVGVVA
jgi:hypothetical protein